MPPLSAQPAHGQASHLAKDGQVQRPLQLSPSKDRQEKQQAENVSHLVEHLLFLSMTPGRCSRELSFLKFLLAPVNMWANHLSSGFPIEVKLNGIIFYCLQIGTQQNSCSFGSHIWTAFGYGLYICCFWLQLLSIIQFAETRVTRPWDQTHGSFCLQTHCGLCVLVGAVSLPLTESKAVFQESWCHVYILGGLRQWAVKVWRYLRRKQGWKQRWRSTRGRDSLGKYEASLHPPLERRDKGVFVKVSTFS